MVTIQDIRRRKEEVRRSLRGDRGSSARQKQDTLRQLEQAERILERKGSQSAVNNILSNISKKAIFGGRQQIQRSTQNAQPNKPTIVRDSSGRVIQASSSVKARVPNIIGKRISTRQSQLITGGIAGTISKKQAQVAIQQQRRIAKRESTKTRDFIDKNRELSQFIDKVNKRIQQENKNRELAQQKQRQFLEELNSIPIQTLAKQKGKKIEQIQKELQDRLTFFNRKEVKQAQTASREISEFTENFERLFKKIPGLRSERFFSKVGRDILASPSRQTVGFALEISQGAKNIRQLQKDTKSNNSVIREQAKKQLKAITKSLPKQVIQGLDPRTPDGFTNLVLISTAVLSPLALRRIIKARTPKSGSIEALDNTNTVVIDSTTKKASIIDKNGKVIAISNKPVNINLFRKLRDNIRSTQTYQKILAKEQKNITIANKAAQKLGFKDAQERILFDRLEKSAKSSNKAKKQLNNLENKIIKRNVNKKIPNLDKRIQKKLPKKEIKSPKNKINDETNKIFDKLEKSLENIRKKEEVKLKKDNKAAKKLGFKDSSEYITYQNALTKARNGSKIALSKVKLIERRVIKRKAKLLQGKNKKPAVLSQRRIKKLIESKGLDVKIKAPKSRKINKKQRKAIENVPSLKQLEATFNKRALRKQEKSSKKIPKTSSNEVIIETKKGVYKLNLSNGKRELFVKKNVGNGKTQQVILQKVESKVIQKPKIKTKTKAKVKKIVERATLAKSLPSIKQIFILLPGSKVLSVNRFAQISLLGQTQQIKPVIIIQQNNTLTPKQKQQINTIFKNINIQDIRYTTDSITKLQQKLRIPVKITKRKTKILKVPRTPKKTKIPQLPKSKISKRKRQKINSYDVYILKNRKYIRVNNGSLTKSAAQSLLDNVLDKSVGASGYIKGSKARPNILARKLPYISQRKFRKPKAKSKLKRVSKVEKNKNRIDTIGEKRGLSAAKVAKRLLKNANKKRRTKKSRAKKRK